MSGQASRWPGGSSIARPLKGRGGGVSERAVFTVSELTARITTQLEEGFPAVWVEGEISNLRLPASGHAYFTLKDEGAQLSAVLFRGRGRRVRFDLEDGMQVLAFGGLDVCVKRTEPAAERRPRPLRPVAALHDTAWGTLWL